MLEELDYAALIDTQRKDNDVGSEYRLWITHKELPEMCRVGIWLTTAALQA